MQRYAIVTTRPMDNGDGTTTPAGVVVNATFWDPRTMPNWAPGAGLRALQSDTLQIGEMAPPAF